jgi:hypothetical protein
MLWHCKSYSTGMIMTHDKSMLSMLTVKRQSWSTKKVIFFCCSEQVGGKQVRLFLVNNLLRKCVRTLSVESLLIEQQQQKKKPEKKYDQKTN